MGDLAIRARGLSKQYAIGSKLPKWNTFNGATSSGLGKHTNTIWALQDVSFEVKQGEVLGIIGRNGSGKSTLLKVLSRITKPTKGEAEIHGRVGSLLEVGTGFHPDLTGRENIHLNGALLGMKKPEIVRHFDAIVAFAEVEQFIDTPVKHYSSGMYVRLAFAVAAHLEPEVLIVDEVLAVGDINFQRKCLGKMEETAKRTGRTILFVSHNMGSILHLCDRAILLDGGRLVEYADTKTVVNSYLMEMSPETHAASGVFVRQGSREMEDLIHSVKLLGQDGVPQSTFTFGESLSIVVETNRIPVEPFGVEVRIKNSQQNLIAYVSSWIGQEKADPSYRPGDTIVLKIASLPFVQDTYYLDFICRMPMAYHVENWWDSVSFTVTACRPIGSPLSLQACDQLGSVVLDVSAYTEG